jgi:DUF1009 family protein
MEVQEVFVIGMGEQKNKQMFKLCLIIGGGNLPFEILKHFNKDEVFIIALKEAEVEITSLQGYNFEVISFVKVGRIIKSIKSRGIIDVCFAGKVQKPSFTNIKPDFKGLFLLFKLLKLKLKGDDKVLRTIITFAEKNKLKIKGVSEICNELLMPKGILTSIKPSLIASEDGLLGMNILKDISKFDIGQGVVLQESVVLGIEGVEGTDNLIKRVGELRYKSKNPPILVKSAKVGQTLKIDMPTIGLTTMQNLAHSGFAGIFVEAGKCLFLEKEKAIDFANRNHIFIVGI